MKCSLILGFLVSTLALPLSAEPKLVDPQANAQTRALFKNLARVAETHVLYGHQNTLAYGHDWIGTPGDHRSDVKDVSGAFPAVYGWDLMDLTANKDEVPGYNMGEENLLAWCREAYASGGLITFSWHMPNPVSGKSFYDRTPAAETLLPGGTNHEIYKQWLDKAAAFFQRLDPMPIVFRPFHEHNGDWFWWGKGIASEEDYIKLWRFTIEYLRDEKGVHNLLYSFSPDRSRMKIENIESDYFYAYPGDDYVDIFGFDDYWDAGYKGNKAPPEERLADFITALEAVVRLAEARGKIPALTETGLDALPQSDWYTSVLLKALDANETTRKIAWVLVWQNAHPAVVKREHFYAPYPGHPSAEDFRKFKQSELILFNDELPPLYSVEK